MGSGAAWMLRILVRLLTVGIGAGSNSRWGSKFASLPWVGQEDGPVLGVPGPQGAAVLLHRQVKATSLEARPLQGYAASGGLCSVSPAGRVG